jgi:hypothetical protein
MGENWKMRIDTNREMHEFPVQVNVSEKRKEDTYKRRDNALVYMSYQATDNLFDKLGTYNEGAGDNKWLPYYGSTCCVSESASCFCVWYTNAVYGVGSNKMHPLVFGVDGENGFFKRFEHVKCNVEGFKRACSQRKQSTRRTRGRINPFRQICN